MNRSSTSELCYPQIMKLLLTSGGITNESIASGLIELTGKLPQETTLAFIPTAANVEEGDKGWLIDDLARLKSMNYKTIDIVDISAVSKEIWLPRLEEADILFFGGGNTFHLMYWIKKSGLDVKLPDLLQTRVYAGISAGSMVASNRIISQAQQLYYDDHGKYEDTTGLSFVNFAFKPHLNSPFFPKVRSGPLMELAKEIPETIYALDDHVALKIDGNIEVIGPGEYLILNQ